MTSVSRHSTLLFGAILFTIPILSSAHGVPISFKNCAELHESGQTISGVYTIKPDHSDAFDVYCDQTTDRGGWTVFQRRVDGSVDFHRTWADYKRGFGSFLIGEFWLGLDKIHRLTREKKNNTLRVDLGVNSIKVVYTEYKWFAIGNETAKYRLNIGNLTKATVEDSLSAHDGSEFSTWDRKHHHCTEKGRESWWFNDCYFLSNLNGIYGYDGAGKIHWGLLDPKDANRAPTTSEMKVRPVAFSKSFQNEHFDSKTLLRQMIDQKGNGHWLGKRRFSQGPQIETSRLTHFIEA